MAVVIRLQGLPVEAGSADIRHFFTGLNIPDGGVHIIGGKLGEVFIIFATDEDARRAMSRTGGMIKQSYIRLFLSSKTEMQNTLEMNRKGGRDMKYSGVSSVENLSKIITAVKKGIHQNKYGNDRPDSGSYSSGGKQSENVHKPSVGNRGTSGVRKDTKEPKEDESIYVFLFGLPYSASEDDLKHFFDGLHIAEIIFLKRTNGVRNGNALVKFDSVDDANASLKRNNEYMGHRFISVTKSTEEKWVEAGGQIEYLDVHSHRDGSYGDVNKHSLSRSSKRQRVRSRSPRNREFYLHLDNLPIDVKKQDIKHLFGDPGMAESQIKLLLPKYNDKKIEGFVRLDSQKHYERCLGLHKSRFCGHTISIVRISRTSMLMMIDSRERHLVPERGSSQDKSFPPKNIKERSNLKRCLYLRNFPFDVTKTEVKKFFVGFPVHEDHIFLLYDSKDVGLGEALVRFPNENEAILAEGLNHQRFLGTEVLLKRISDEQMIELASAQYPQDRMTLRHSPVNRDHYGECIDSYEHSAGPYELSKEFVNKPYEPPTSSLGLPEFGHGHGDFRGPERLRSQFCADFHGADEPFAMNDTEKSSMTDYIDFDPIQIQNFGRSSGLIRMKNVSYTATTEEILDFFYGYNVIPESVLIRVSKHGMPRGMATVCMKNYDDAVVAVRELNGRPIGQRKVSLTLLKY
ncbi:RNA-binding protein 12B-like [Pelobates fuscus]|uniref:RNA-binding protein 12B-like n=1 Tax=Pelobates fuscus TaxID=191477 RepID=UPI002FE43A09